MGGITIPPMRISLTFLFVLATCGSAAAQPALSVGGVSAAPGSAASGELQIAPRAGDPGTTVPFTIINGAAAGPVLALVSGTHGMEYAPIIASQRLRASLDPTTLRGAVILVHVANMPSFLGRTIYYSPVDGKNLNRVFPGKADGTISERIAEAITREVISRATHLVDLHCGDGNESLRPYSYWITTGDPKVAEVGRAMALAFGLDHIVVDRERPADPAASMYVSNTAITRGKPALTTETGGMARVDEESIALVMRGVDGLLRHLGMRDGGPPPVAAPVFIDRNVVLRAAATGIFYAEVERGFTVAKGTRIGRITDFHGRILEEISAPFDGEILYVVGTPPVSKGEPVAMVGARGSRD
jgi:predicted deacylase